MCLCNCVHLELLLRAGGVLWRQQLQDSRNDVSVGEAIGANCGCQHILGPTPYLERHTQTETHVQAHGVNGGKQMLGFDVSC